MFRTMVSGRERVPTQESFILLPNHVSLLDAPILGIALDAALFQVGFLASHVPALRSGRAESLSVGLTPPREATTLKFISQAAQTLATRQLRKEAMLLKTLGTILVQKGFCSQEEVDMALHLQKLSGKKVGEILVESNSISHQHIINVLFDQYHNSFRNTEADHREEQLRELITLEKELKLARDIQQGFLPQNLPDIPGLDVAGACTMCCSVGGDYYEVFESDFGCFNIVVSDVSGHGVASSLVMAGLRSMLRIELQTDCLYLEKIAAKINKLLYKDFSNNGLYITSLFVRYEPETQGLCLVNAGHPRPITSLPDKATSYQKADIPLGIFENTEYTLYRTTIEPGECILLYSDGLTESEDEQGHPYGEQRLQEFLTGSTARTSRELVDSILMDVQSRTVVKRDDITLLALWRH